MKNIKIQKGITLIALVITIIVMLILVGVTISMAINGGLFSYAKKAAKDTETQKQAEQELASGQVTVNGKDYASIDDYLNNKPQPSNYSEELLDETTKVLKENAKYVSDGKTAIIPKGFTIVADENGEKSIDKGLIITDKVDSTGKSIGNEYVWVPVEKGELVRTEWKDNEPTRTIDSKYTEEWQDGLVNSVKTYKGFYIGRYEAGSEEVRTREKKDTLPKVLTQRELYPYNWVSQTNAMRKIAEMYKEDTYGVEAILPYGAIWDQTLNFVKDDTHSVTKSTNWGNYYDHEFTFNGKYAKDDFRKSWSEHEDNETKPENASWLLTTGASEENKTKNIYDLAGNVAEWTQEASSIANRVFRGGVSGDTSSSASYRNAYSPTYIESYIGFRVALYIK